VAEFDHQVVGFVRSGPSRDNDDDPGQVGEIYAIYVHPDYWGRRVGYTLLQTATQQLQQQGFGEVTLWTLRDNRHARAFYERTGLAVDGATKETERGGELAVEVRYRRSL
jgi:ribosomal protein S18 acetylase RimI-like enzyme